MTKYILGVFVCFSSILAHSAGNNINNKDFNKFLSALASVESSNNPKAFNKQENAIGIYQIREKHFLDAQSFNKNLKKYTHKDCFSPEISKLVVIAYFSKYERNNLNNNNFEALARCHNSGPSWKNKKHLTNNYYSKIRRALNSGN